MGIGRKMNYAGDILVYLGFALCTGVSSIYPYIIFFLVASFLMARAKQDDEVCAKKYGKLWEDYCKIATFRIIPVIY